MLIRLFAFLPFFVSATAQASYFVDTPPMSIELMIEGCFADTDCAAKAARLVPLFARSTGLPERSVRENLQSCLNPDRNMGFCVEYEVFALKDELTEIVQARLRKNSVDKAALPFRDMQIWGRKLKKDCFRHVKKELPDAEGRYLSEWIVSCEADRVIALVKKLR